MKMYKQPASILIISGIDEFFNTIETLRGTRLLTKLIFLSLLTWFIEGGMFYVVGLVQ
jgi:hypothetical protein